MVPPPQQDNWWSRFWSPSRGISAWKIVKSFDSAQQCEEARANLLTPGSESVKKFLKKYGMDDTNGRTPDSSARCIASDDPRLKEK